MGRTLRWAVTAVGLVVLAAGGASIFWPPAHEVLYSLSQPTVVCHPGGCLGVYRLEVGNSGSTGQQQVLVRLRSPVLQTAILRPRVQDFGKLDRAAEVSDTDGIRTYALGRMPPRQRVEVSFVLQRSEATALPGWDDIFVAVEPAEGRVQAGNPAGTMLLRIWYELLRAF